MKSRIKKLLAAALALCLIAALVPGAALAASTPTGNFSTVDKDKPDEATKYHNTLAEAVEYASKFTDAKYKVITVVANSVDVSGTLPDIITLDVNGKTINVTSNFTAYGPIELDGTMNIASGQTATISGKVTGSGTIVAKAGTAGAVGGTLAAGSAKFDDNTGSVDIDVERYAKATLPASYTSDGAITIAAQGELTVSDTLTVNGSVEIGEGATLTSNVKVMRGGNVTNAGTISGIVTIDTNASMTISSSDASVDNITVNGKLSVTSPYKQTKTITVNDGATMSISGSSYEAKASLKVDGSLNVSGCVFTATNNLNVGNNATIDFSDSEVSVSSYNFNGTTTVEDSKFTVGTTGKTTELVGQDSLDGSFVFDKQDGKKVITIKSADVDEDYAFGTDKADKYVVEGTLNIGSYATVGNELNVASGSTVAVANGGVIEFQSNGLLTGKGEVTVQGIVYNENSKNNFDTVDVYMLSGGQLYSKTSDVSTKIHDYIAVTATAPNGESYTYAVRYSGGGTYSITKGTVTGGTGTINIDSSAEGSSTVNFSVSTADGYVIDKAWYVMERSSEAHYVYASGTSGSFQMPVGNITFNVSLKKAETPAEPEGDTYTITTTTSANGRFVVNATKADAGEVVTITTSPNSGYKVSRVSVTGAVASKFTDNVYTFTMPNQNVTVSVTFERGDYQVTLTNYTYDDGRISLSTGTTTTGRYPEGERVYIYAYPDRDFYVRSLTITRTDNRQTVNYYESSSSDDVFYFDMPASDVTVRAYFTDGVYEIATDIDGSGRLTITGEDGNVTDVAEEGEEIRITASPSNNYRLGDIYVNYTDADDEDQVIYPEVEYKNNGNVDYYWFEMPEYDVEIYADFGEGDYVAWIDRSDMKNGTIRVSPNVADEDDTVSIYVTPDTGYQLDELIVEDEDGRDVTTTSLASGTRYTFRMPDSDVTVTATFKSRSYSSNFTDVPRYEWYYEAVSYVASEGLMNGVSTTQFNPNGTASRAQIVTILWRLAGEPSALTGAFTDVPAGQYYSTAVAWASRQGIVTGVGNNRFEPNSNITREQLAVILYRYAQDAGYTTSASANITGYYDYARVNSYARTAMSWAVGAGLITGTSTTTLSPQDTATRAQVATILMRFCENIAK